MNIIISQYQNQITVFNVEGRIHLGNAHELRGKAQQEYDQGMRNMILNMAEIQSLTSEGLRTIHFIYNLLQDHEAGDTVQKSRHLKLLSPSDDIRRILKVAGYDAFLDIYDNLQDALVSF